MTQNNEMARLEALLTQARNDTHGPDQVSGALMARVMADADMALAERAALGDIDFRGRERLDELAPEKISREAGEKPCRRAKTPQGNRRVEHRAARIGREAMLAQRRLARQHINQRFTAA